MEIIIHGTKGGWKVLFPTLNNPVIVGDSRSAHSSESAVGSSAYSISINQNGYVLTKFVIVRDVSRSMATGNIAFSAYLNINEKLTGKESQYLLDKLADNYCNKYVVHDNLDNVKEDWSFVNDVLSAVNIKNQVTDDHLNFQQGASDPAFIYYSSDAELQKYFDAPYQDEYNPFKQVYFVRNELRDKPENPLNALRHGNGPESDLSGKVDLENQEYKLKFSSNPYGAYKIAVKINGGQRHDGNKFRKKDKLEIIYSRPEHKSYTVQQASIVDIDNKYVVIDDNNKTVTVNSIDLEPEEYKLIDIIAHDQNLDGDIKYDIEILTLKNKRQEKVSKFIGQEINQTWALTIKHKDYEPYLIQNYCAATTIEPIHIALVKKKEKKKYKTDAGKRGKFKNGYPDFIDEDKINDVKQFIIADLGYKFIKFEINDETLVAKYRKKPFYLQLYFLIITGVLVIAFSCFLIFRKKEKVEPVTFNQYEIIQYVEGNELNLEKLNEFKQNFCDNVTFKQNQQDDGKSLWNLWGLLGSSKPSMNLNYSNSKPDYCLKIDKAISIRKAINKGDLDALKVKEYSSEQNNLRNAINNIDYKFKLKIAQTIHSYQVSTMDLNQVADFITNLEKLLIIREEIKNMVDEDEVKLTEIDNISFPVDTIKGNIKKEISERIELLNSKNKHQSDRNSIITKDSQETKGEIKSNKKDPNANIGSNQSKIENEFWELVKSDEIEKDKFKKFKKNHESEKNEYIDWVKNIYDNKSQFKKYKEIPASKRQNANTIQDLNQLLNQ